jgi:hypothetical protein
LKINFRHERTRRTVPFCTMETTSARLAEGWRQVTTILIRVDPWKATSFSHVSACLFLQDMRRGRLIRLTDEDTMSWRDHSDDKDNPGGKLRSRIGFSTQTGTRRKAGQPTRAEWKRKGTRPALCCVKNGVRLNWKGVASAGGQWRCGLARPLE